MRPAVADCHPANRCFAWRWSAILNKKIQLFKLEQINENEKRGLNYDPTLNWSIEGKLVGGDNTIQQLRPYLMSDGRQAAQNQPGNSKQSNLHCAKEQTAAAQGQQSSPKYTHKMAQIAQIYY